MKLTFLGTAAAEGIPALWCECEVCRKAKTLGGKEIRRRCSYLLDGDTLIDFGPDAYWQSIAFGIDLTAIDRIVFTHSHSDHLNPADVYWRRSPYFSQVTKPLTVIGDRRIFSTIIEHAAKGGAVSDLAELFIRPVHARSGERLKDGDLELLPLRANHDRHSDPLVYVFTRGGKSIFVANDTGWLSEESWKLLEGVKLDAAVIESTGGLKGADWRDGHMGANTSVAFRKRLVEMGCLAPDAPAVVNHFTHNCGANHDDLVKFFTPHGIEVACDGFTLEV
ncbi:MAG: MBL fold metallo-hydrolase [Lentisphaeria bacterium]|nr:MBL fold metallo-hydrolase [Lentisphaeria bacterium]